MATLPESNLATATNATEGDVKTFLNDQRSFIYSILGSDSDNKTYALASLGAALNGSVVKTSSYTITKSDKGKVIKCNGSLTISSLSASVLGDGFVFVISNIGNGIVTFDPNFTETVDGYLTIDINSKTSVIIYCDGSSFISVSGKSQNPIHGVYRRIDAHSGSFTVPASSIKVTIVGAGGGGGGSTNSGQGGGGGCGGGGIKYINNLVIGSVISYTVGAGGTGGSPGGSGSSGGTSSFGGYITATGGAGGSASGSAGNNGGNTGADIAIDSINYAASAISGGNGGGGARFSFVDQYFLTSFGGVGAVKPSLPGHASNGGNASGFASGGGGSSSYGANASGGNGAPGLIVIEW